MTKTTKKRIVMNPEVRIIPVWRSTDGVLLGYIPAIFGSDRFERPLEWRTFLLPALDHLDLHTEDGTHVYASQKEALDAWEGARVVPLKGGPRGQYAIPEDSGDLIDRNGFYRTLREVETPEEKAHRLGQTEVPVETEAAHG